MRSTIGYAIAALLIGCSSPTSGRVVVAVTVDWEGAYISDDGLDAIDKLRAKPAIPLTHFVSAAYFTKAEPDPDVARELRDAMEPGDELAAHLHGWVSLAKAAGIEPRVSPSFTTGTDELQAVGDRDTGFDLDLDAYSTAEQRALLRTTRELLSKVGPVSDAFRAGGYVAGPRLRRAMLDEGMTIDSSAIDPRQLASDPVFAARVAETWGTPKSQPWLVEDDMVELPIAAIADRVTAVDVTNVMFAAIDELAKHPDRDVFVVLALHQETAADHASAIRTGIDAARAKSALLVFVTISQAAARARAQLAR
ncbi:MAG TPA: hypothetical protein VGM39_07480 [Kofleriaceae bacterium]